jgi:peptidoglycan/LPS O-acetylase OafA/YrhL
MSPEPQRRQSFRKREPNRYFAVLDGLRGIAALAVVTRHAPAYFNSISPTPAGPFFESYLAVDFFFVLSGFVLAFSYGHQICAGMSAPRFLMIRLARLYPLYLLALAISAPLAMWQVASGALNGSTLAVDLIAALMFLPSPITQYSLFPLNWPAWSLFFELLANFCFGLFGARFRDSFLSMFVLATGAVLILTVAYGAVGFGSGQIGPGISSGPMDAGSQWPGFGAGCVRVAYSFFAGVLVYRVWRMQPRTIVVSPYLLFGALTLIMAAHPVPEWRLTFDLSATIFAFPAIVYLGASSIASGVCGSISRTLGRASFAVYVLQVPVYELSIKAAASATRDANPVFAPWAVYVVFLVAFALIADRCFDNPARRMLMRRLDEIGASRRTHVDAQPIAGP